PMSVETTTLPALHVASMRHTGPYGSPSIAQLWASFGTWATAQGLMTPRRRMLGISLDNPMTTPQPNAATTCASRWTQSSSPTAG
ncbi:MAG: transcriptional regulator, partial [Rhodoferax sp.]|nr:transcriptional regulator [Rhodoferax sp.]